MFYKLIRSEQKISLTTIINLIQVKIVNRTYSISRICLKVEFW